MYEIEEANVKLFVADSGMCLRIIWKMAPSRMRFIYGHQANSLCSEPERLGTTGNTRIRDVVINEEEGLVRLCRPSLAASWRVWKRRIEADPFRYPDSEST